ncbi:MAG: sugar ABC transporter permease, partial [Cohnella sp.]|nr:sugar ABC transporter permease [Cohnella sp.]
MQTPSFKVKRYVVRDWLTSYLFLLPALCFFVLFVLYPMGKGVYLSFFDYSLRDFSFVGLDNYKELLTNDTFLKSMRNTVVIVLIAVPVFIGFSLFVATKIYKKNEA